VLDAHFKHFKLNNYLQNNTMKKEYVCFSIIESKFISNSKKIKMWKTVKLVFERDKQVQLKEPMTSTIILIY
jgi:hypothetical protein